MEYVNEPAQRVEEQLTARGVTVVREPYNPGARSLFSDFVGFLRTPDAGSTVTLFEDDEGTVRYYTVARPDPEVAQIRTDVAQLQETTKALEPARLEHIEKRLAAVDALEAKVEALPELEERVKALPQLEARVEELSALDAKVGQLDALRTRIDRLERPR
jgi:hypothetical protein